MENTPIAPNKIMYTCPMHSDVRQEGVGSCPKCGMALVPESTVKPRMVHEDKGLGPITWRSYMPLITIFGLLVVSTTALALRDSAAALFSASQTITYFMAGFFLTFAGFKLIDLKGFAEGYSTYDLLAQKWFGYGYMYPFIELAFGLAMLVGFHFSLILWTEVIVMLFSGIGVAIKLIRGEQFTCACLGTFLKVPLTYVTLIEDFGMAALAILVLLMT